MQRVEGEVQQISEFGARIAATEILRPGTDFRLMLNIFDVSVAVKAQVKYLVDNLGMGVEFQEIRRGDRPLLSYVLSKLRARKVEEFVEVEVVRASGRSPRIGPAKLNQRRFERLAPHRRPFLAARFPAKAFSRGLRLQSLRVLRVQNVFHWKGECGSGRRHNLPSPQQLLRLFRLYPHGPPANVGSATRATCRALSLNLPWRPPAPDGCARNTWIPATLRCCSSRPRWLARSETLLHSSSA